MFLSNDVFGKNDNFVTSAIIISAPSLELKETIWARMPSLSRKHGIGTSADTEHNRTSENTRRHEMNEPLLQRQQTQTQDDTGKNSLGTRGSGSNMDGDGGCFQTSGFWLKSG